MGKSKLNLEGSRHTAFVHAVQVLMTSEAGLEDGEGKVIQPQEIMGCVGRHVGTSDFPNATLDEDTVGFELSDDLVLFKDAKLFIYSSLFL